MLKKVLNTSFLNAAASGISFILNYFIVKWLGLSIFGEFAVYGAYVTLGTIVYSIIPTNFSIFRFQDDKEYKSILLTFYVLSSLVFILYLTILKMTGLIGISLLVAFIYSVPLGLQGYFDIKLQATNQLTKYFFLLFIISVFKIGFVFATHFFGYLTSFEQLVLITAIPQAIIILFLLLKEDSKILKPGVLVTFISTYLKDFSPYYFNIISKKLKESLTVLLFNPFITKEIIGIYALFIKLAQFIFGLSRNIEAFFMNRKNIEDYKDSFYTSYLIISFVLQLAYLLVGLVYMKAMTDNFYIYLLIIQSFLVYPHVRFLFARAELTAQYKNKESNLSELVSIGVIFTIFILAMIFDYFTLNMIMATFILSTFSQHLYLITIKK